MQWARKVGWDASTRPSRVDVEKTRPAGIVWCDRLDRDGMERVSDWIVCALLLFWGFRVVRNVPAKLLG